MDSTSNPGPHLDVGPDNRPFTLPEVQAGVADLIEQFAGEPGIELLGFVATMLANTRCTCADVDTGNADVIPFAPRTRDNQQ
ncbi:hypothetical protein [Lentzea sp. CA-135723]|uniref:hypothetical protein n=1 Tax=Lentzea sp. CA-135723 TaxID=3239950 RepID=UPI003D8ECD25